MSDPSRSNGAIAGLYVDEAIGRAEAIIATLTVQEIPDDDAISWALLAAHSLKGLTAQAGDAVLAERVHALETEIEAIRTISPAHRTAPANAIVTQLREIEQTLSTSLPQGATRDLDLRDIASAAETEVQRIARRRDITVTVDLVVPDGVRVPRHIAGVLVDALGHVLRNAVAHGSSQGGAIRIVFTADSEAVSVVVGDRGNAQSRAAEVSLDAGRGVGVLAAGSRLSAIGGDLSVSPAPWGGMSVTLRAPFGRRPR